MLRASSVEEVQAAVRAHARLRPIAGRTKPALSAAAASEETGPGAAAPGTAGPRDDAAAGAGAGTAAPAADSGSAASAPSASVPALLDVSALTGIVDFQPAECTFTARASTTLADVERLLAPHRLYLPFDPPFVDRGATLGGTVAAGLSGPGRVRYGGVRDFLLGLRFVSGDGRVVRGGGRVVKNAAGFSLQHLLLGSLGRLGVLTELTFKVFPRPAAALTLVADAGTFEHALDALVRLRRSTFELDAMEFVPPATLILRLAGSATALDARAGALTAWLALPPQHISRLDGRGEAAAWHDAREFTWALGSAETAEGAAAAVTLIKVPLTPSRIPVLENALRQASQAAVARRYSAGGEVAWLAWTAPIADADRLLRAIDLQGLVLLSTGGGAPPADPLIGVPFDRTFLDRARQALDPRGVFA